jgi:hypothetical protein
MTTYKKSAPVLALFFMLFSCEAPMDAAEPIDAATCSVPTLQTLFPGPDLPSPSPSERPAADACLGAPHDVIIVLGCPSQGDGTPSDCQMLRADIAAALYKKGLGPHIITSGGAVQNRFVEAEALRDLLIARGIPEDVIHLEPRAEHTDENIYYSTKLMATAGWNDALVVSDDPGHLVYVALCDSNCCVGLGRLTVISVPLSVDGADVEPIAVGHYALYPTAEKVTAAECAHLEQPTKFLCRNLPTRRACADRLAL